MVLAPRSGRFVGFQCILDHALELGPVDAAVFAEAGILRGDHGARQMGEISSRLTQSLSIPLPDRARSSMTLEKGGGTTV